VGELTFESIHRRVRLPHVEVPGRCHGGPWCCVRLVSGSSFGRGRFGLSPLGLPSLYSRQVSPSPPLLPDQPRLAPAVGTTRPRQHRCVFRRCGRSRRVRFLLRCVGLWRLRDSVRMACECRRWRLRTALWWRSRRVSSRSGCSPARFKSGGVVGGCRSAANSSGLAVGGARGQRLSRSTLRQAMRTRSVLCARRRPPLTL
jgi:hypothetical protein